MTAPLLHCGRIDDHDPHRWTGLRPRRRPYWCVGAPVVSQAEKEKSA